MNPLTNIRSLNNLIDNEIKLGKVGTKTSWHEQYRSSAWVFAGGMPFELTEGDVICIFSQFGEIVNINLIRDQKTGKSKGFGFICYEDQKSTDLAVDNFNGAKILDRLIRVDHVLNYKPPKDSDEIDDVTKFLREEGCAAETMEEKKNTLKEICEKKSKVRVKKEHDRHRYDDRSRGDKKYPIQDDYDRGQKRDEYTKRSSDSNRPVKTYRRSRSHSSTKLPRTDRSSMHRSSGQAGRGHEHRRRRSRSNSSSRSRSKSPRGHIRDHRKEPRESYHGRHEPKRY